MTKLEPYGFVHRIGWQMDEETTMIDEALVET
jgi:hypothetical protein